MHTDARSAILADIRRANHPGDGSHTPLGADADWAGIVHGYRTASSMLPEELRHRFVDRLRDYDAQVLESPRHDRSAAIARLLLARQISRVVIPSGFPAELLPPGFDFVPEAGLTFAEMDRCQGVLTGATLAIAETGTIVLQNAAGQGRRATSLIPDYHLCLVDSASLVATVPEAIARLQATATLPTTFISGPSATADIEMTRIKGVHGPRFLDVILIDP